MPDAKIIGFPRGAGSQLAALFAETGVDAVGLDWMIDRDFARERIQTRCRCRAISIRWRCWPAARRSIARSTTVLDAFAGGPFIFNLGHGILPETPIAHVEQMLKRVRGT